MNTSLCAVLRYMPHKPEAPTDSKSKRTVQIAPTMRKRMEKRRIIKVRLMVLSQVD
jgi:hypothetical protein